MDIVRETITEWASFFAEIEGSDEREIKRHLMSFSLWIDERYHGKLLPPLLRRLFDEMPLYTHGALSLLIMQENADSLLRQVD